MKPLQVHQIRVGLSLLKVQESQQESKWRCTSLTSGGGIRRGRATYSRTGVFLPFLDRINASSLLAGESHRRKARIHKQSRATHCCKQPPTPQNRQDRTGWESARRVCIRLELCQAQSFLRDRRARGFGAPLTAERRWLGPVLFSAHSWVFFFLFFSFLIVSFIFFYCQPRFYIQLYNGLFVSNCSRTDPENHLQSRPGSIQGPAITS